MVNTNSSPSKFWAYVALIIGVFLFVSGGAASLTYLGAPFVSRGRDILAAQLGQMAAIFLGLVCGTLALYHGFASIMNRASRPLRLPPFYFFWILFALTLGLGHVLLNFRIAEQFLFPFLFLLGASLPTLSVIAWGVRRLGAPITWRQGALALVAGSTLSIVVALVLEGSLSLILFFFTPPLRWMSSASIVLSPIVILFLITTALQAPIPEEFAKALGVPIFGRQRITNEQQAFAIGLFCGAGFAIVENMLYEGLYATIGGWSWGGVTLLRGIGAGLHPICTGLIALGWFRARQSGWFKLLSAYAISVGLHTLWNGGFTALVYLTGLGYYTRNAKLSLYGEPIQISLIAFLVVLSLGLWWLLYRIVTSLAQGIEPAVSRLVISRRAVALWALACVIVLIPLGATLGPAWSSISGIVLPGALSTPLPMPIPTIPAK